MRKRAGAHWGLASNIHFGAETHRSQNVLTSSMKDSFPSIDCTSARREPFIPENNGEILPIDKRERETFETTAKASYQYKAEEVQTSSQCIPSPGLKGFNTQGTWGPIEPITKTSYVPMSINDARQKRVKSLHTSDIPQGDEKQRNYLTTMTRAYNEYDVRERSQPIRQENRKTIRGDSINYPFPHTTMQKHFMGLPGPSATLAFRANNGVDQGDPNFSSWSTTSQREPFEAEAYRVKKRQGGQQHIHVAGNGGIGQHQSNAQTSFHAKPLKSMASFKPEPKLHTFTQGNTSGRDFSVTSRSDFKQLPCPRISLPDQYKLRLSHFDLGSQDTPNAFSTTAQDSYAYRPTDVAKSAKQACTISYGDPDQKTFQNSTTTTDYPPRQIPSNKLEIINIGANGQTNFNIGKDCAFADPSSTMSTSYQPQKPSAYTSVRILHAPRVRGSAIPQGDPHKVCEFVTTSSAYSACTPEKAKKPYVKYNF